ncbi:MAG: helix-turn-helix domain-containing protein [Bacteroides sp.]|nr:helix-turn-helix domain-containing protein [Bacteroides sp.]
MYFAIFKYVAYFEGCRFSVPSNRCPQLNGKPFIDDKELADRLSLHRRTLQNFRNDNILPYYKIGGKVIYDEAEIQAWLNSNYHPRF